eukprot:Plantae.Rhodophyta-Purpureofilum_apyrenoidigerum.ctg25994.p3 GENE.Plantae.Rhodophyta-Purpureofilum_apyrenoidigerum.ctg25994~~Plantae.Rhodophyta-Purpureofilum_apyrenoidigerum.ctg25994.p3  ORF type:complete len:147 (-),score=23.55 Plantae.Rhodophyta-Purpureofilum_apyrenoidigerum.ctg25994:519-959(-)
MDSVLKYGEDFVIGGSLPPLTQAFVDKYGIKSVLYNRAASEDGYSETREKEAKDLGLEYKHIPIEPSKLSRELADTLTETIAKMPKPILMECASAKRASAASCLYTARTNKIPPMAAIEDARQCNLPFVDAEPVKQWVISNIEAES